MSRKFFERIGYDGNLEDISRKVCQDFSIGEFESNELILVGYEDFNFILKTDKGNYVIKVFANSREDDECKRIVDVNLAAMEGDVTIPKLIKSSYGYLHRTTIGSSDMRICVLEYIDGKNLYALKHKANEDEIKFLSRQASLINSLTINPRFIYDGWAITNFAREFKRKGKYLEKEDFGIIEALLEEFNMLDIENLPHCFVHGDLISPNVIRENTGRMWIIDFGASNRYPRIQELAVLACDVLFIENDKIKSDKNLEIALDEYQKTVKLTDNELAILPLYVRFGHAMHVLSANYEKVAKENRSKENEYFLRIGRAGLRN
ncbi:MAG: phosphotransferase [Candidatus Moranbacteria bacterium]|nr:phosphotransferase [Candidatus Moranbacteria bacterium]